MSAAERLHAYERNVVTLLFARDFEPALKALGARADRWRIYRRMARGRLSDVIADTFSRTRQIFDGRWDALLERYFDEAPPRSPYIRDVPGEFAQWLLRTEHADPLRDAPPWARDLLRFEAARAEVSFIAEESGARDTFEHGENSDSATGRVVALAFDRPAVLTPAHRLLTVAWSVHELPFDDAPIDVAQLVEAQRTLCLYRDPDSHRVRVLDLTPFSAALLAEVARDDRAPVALVDAVKSAAASTHVPIDEALVVSLAAFVEDLMRRGVWLGSRASP